MNEAGTQTVSGAESAAQPSAEGDREFRNASGVSQTHLTGGAISNAGPEARPEGRPGRWKGRVTLFGLLITVVAATVVLPPLINIGRYQRRVTAMMSRSMGRPVQVSSVGLRLLPMPGFVLNDLSVSEDAGFGTEPVLSARTVVASVGLVSLWRGKPAITRVSVDEASLNLVRNAEGRWNLEALMMGAQPALTAGGNGSRTDGTKGAGGNAARFPYLEATNSRINLKEGAEKSPFSVVGADLSLWQDQPGEWRVRLKGQPVRTDTQMSWADTGELRMEGTLHSAPQLRDMPLSMQVEWREAQLGQLSRLILGSDEGWRGDMTADVDVQGTLDSAQTKARLRATGVRREEFAPETPLDLDANCNFRFQHSQNAVHGLVCDTAIGVGHLRLTAEVPGLGGHPAGTLEAKDVPLQAGLDLLRTVRRGFAPGISVKGAANGKLEYTVAEPAQLAHSIRGGGKAARDSNLVGKTDVAGEMKLAGEIRFEGVTLKGGGLKEPLVLPAMIWLPAGAGADNESAEGGQAAMGLATKFTLPMMDLPGGAGPAQAKTAVKDKKSGQGEVGADAAALEGQAFGPAMMVRLTVSPVRFDAAVTGTATATRIRNLAYAFGLPAVKSADDLSGGTADLNLRAGGPWIVEWERQAATQAAATGTAAAAGGGADAVTGSVQLHHARWKTDYLAWPVDVQQGVITVSGDFTKATMAVSGDFTYGFYGLDGLDGEAEAAGAGASVNTLSSSAAGGASGAPVSSPRVRGRFTVHAASDCAGSDCPPQVEIAFGALDVSAVQAALVAPAEKKTLLSPLMDRVDRMRSSDHAKWPDVTIALSAESLVLGPATVVQPHLLVKMDGDGMTISKWEAGLLGGVARGTGRCGWADKVEYQFDGEFAGVNAASVGALTGSRWSGGTLSGKGGIKLSGLDGKALSASAGGDGEFRWKNGMMTSGATLGGIAAPVRFDEWSGTFTVAGGKLQLGENALRFRSLTSTVAGGIAFGHAKGAKDETAAERTVWEHAGGQPAAQARLTVKTWHEAKAGAGNADSGKTDSGKARPGAGTKSGR